MPLRNPSADPNPDSNQADPVFKKCIFIKKKDRGSVKVAFLFSVILTKLYKSFEINELSNYLIILYKKAALFIPRGICCLTPKNHRMVGGTTACPTCSIHPACYFPSSLSAIRSFHAQIPLFYGSFIFQVITAP